MGEDERLIEAVRGFECLWKVSIKGYKDLRAKENAWKSVTEKVGDTTEAECQRRWKSLRDKYVRELKKVKKGKSGDEGPPTISCWPLFQVLSFIADTVHHRPSTTNFRKYPNPRQSSPLPPEVGSDDPEKGNDCYEDDDSFAEASTEPSSSRETSISRETLRSKNAPKQKRKRLHGLDEVETAILSKLNARMSVMLKSILDCM